MARDKIGITLNGDIPLSAFAEAVQNFSQLINQLSREIGEETPVEWQIEMLESGSATAEVVGYSPNLEVVERIVAAYETIGESLQERKPIPYSPGIIKSAYSLIGILNGKISSIELYTPEKSSIITETIPAESLKKRSPVFGTITGLVETLSRHQRLRFILYDNLFDRAVFCYFSEDQRELMRDVWDKYVSVTGMILRDSITGRPFVIREIQKVEIVSDPPLLGFKQARGVIPWKKEYGNSEQIIRQIRDEE